RLGSAASPLDEQRRIRLRKRATRARTHRPPGAESGALGPVHDGLRRARHHGARRVHARGRAHRPREPRTARRPRRRPQDARRPHGRTRAARGDARLTDGSEREDMTAALKQAPLHAYTRILAMGAARGENAVPNDDLVGPIDSSDEWIRQRTGIVTRTRAEHATTAIDLATDAAREIGRAHV